MTIPYPRISPVLFHIGPFAVRWYGLMYLVGYVIGVRLARIRTRLCLWTLTVADIDALVGYLVVGMLVGARLTYIFVYDWPTYRSHPLESFAIWHGGLSFHGAAIGMALASALFARRRGFPTLMVWDGLAVCAPPGLFAGRLGNFINAELYGRPTSVSWAMVFPTDPRGLPRHPSQLYEAFGEGLVLGAVLWWLQRRASTGSDQSRDLRDGYLAAAFLAGYGIVRFLVEFTRQPDAQLGLVLGPFSMGQLLSTVTVVAGAVLATVAHALPPRHLITDGHA